MAFLVSSAAAEGIRLTLEKGFILFSVAWQYLPLERFSKWLGKVGIKNEWQVYYSHSQDEKISKIQAVISRDAQSEPRFRYFSGFKIIPRANHLRSGNVREIASGEVFIHNVWINDPWLLLGICARRSAWIFDPRYLPRPFYYRSQANHLMTNFVLEYARVFPPFAFYQIGHEIKSARFGIFFKWARIFGWELEQYVQKNGEYLFDRFIAKIGRALGIEHEQKSIPILDDAWVVAEAAGRIDQGEKMTPLLVAEEYAYPLIYVEEVLWQKIEAALSPKKNL